MEDDKLYAAYFKKDIEYYLNTFERYRNGNKYVFNVYAFFFGVFWFMYRKMYREALIIILVIVAEGYLEDILTAGMNETAIKVVTRISTIAIGIIVAMLANALYIRKAESIIGKAKQEQTDQEDLISDLQKKGGVSYLFLIAVLIGIAGIVSYFYNMNNQG